MMVFGGSELIGLLFRIYAIVLLSGIISIPFVALRIKPVISIITVTLVALLTGFIAIQSFSSGGVEYFNIGGVIFRGNSGENRSSCRLVYSDH